MIVNDVMSYIYDNFQIDIDINYLAKELNISSFYLHKIFKQQIGKNIYATIKTIRLQKASNILLTNKYSTITEISNMCGYSNQTSFIRAFKAYFNQTPTYWRKGGFKEYSKSFFKEIELKENKETNFSLLKQDFVKVKKRMAYYIREEGYNFKQNEVWQKLKSWAYTYDIDSFECLGIYHDNPILTPVNECQYVACLIPKSIETNKNLKQINASLPQLEIQECFCVTFEFLGNRNDLLLLIQWVYHYWLPKSGYEKITIPPYIIYDEKIKLKDNYFKGIYHVPIRYV